MAFINNLYVFIEDESLTHDVEGTSHPVEKGIEITDHIRRTPVEISLKGRIVGYTTQTKCPLCGVPLTGRGRNQKCSSCNGNLKNLDGYSSFDVLSRLKALQKSGSLINYVGRNSLSNMQIRSFSTAHPYTNSGGCNFDMTLVEVRIAQPAYTENKSGGTQQVETGDNKNVYHIVKKGDCIWNLVTKQYKSLEPKFSKIMDKCNWVMSKNPDAFSRKGDFRTLQIGKKILIGVRK